MNREKAIRLKFYELLSGNITYDSAQVPVWDAKLQDDSNDRYVILTEQRARLTENFGMDSWECEQDMSVYCIEYDTVSRDVTDDIAEQIETLLYAALRPGIESNGWQLNNISLLSAAHSMFELTDSKSQISKDLTFKITATKTQLY